MIRLYHTSDLHHHLGIAAPLLALRERAPGYLIDCGDALRGSQTVYHRNEPIVAEMNAAGYDLRAMGNREFHYIYGLVQARLRTMRGPVLCSNLIDLRSRALAFEFDRRVTIGSRTLRFFALLVPQYPTGSLWERLFGWRFLDPVTVAREVAASTTSDEILVLLSHLGLAVDRRLAAAVPRLDCILGGHSHDTLTVPEYVGDVPIIHAGPYGRFVSRTEFIADTERGRARLADFALLPLLPGSA